MPIMIYNIDIKNINPKQKGGNKMAGRNGTGPLGMGPLTGRGLGPCGRGYFANRRPRVGYGRGLRYGRGLDYHGLYPNKFSPID
ncbi:MAG: DUF5320 domain-containing protein [Bacteroidales bacterium]|nr:DUF5320 domain-containing protein [Bacteroidales bacterium]